MRYIHYNRIKRFTAGFLALLFLVTGLIPCHVQAAKNPKVLRVAFPQSAGYTMTAPDGHRYGLVVDALNEIAKYTGWEYNYIDVDNEELMGRFQKGDFDLMGGQYYLDGLEDFCSYPNYNCGYTKMVLLAKRSDNHIKSYDLNTFNGKTIGVFDRATENIRRLKIYLKLNNLDCKFKYYTSDQLMNIGKGKLNTFLEKGEVDLLLGNSQDAGNRFYIAASFDSQPHYIVTTPGNQEILNGLNMALEKIYEADPNFSIKLYEENFPTTGNKYIKLNDKEEAYVKKQKSVTVAVPKDWHPMFCLNNNNEHHGLVPDILEKITEYSGLKFTYLYTDNYAQALTKVEEGEADILGFFIGTEEDAIQMRLALTTSYGELGSILVRNTESSYPANNLTGAV